jgi:hypothetical protein
MNLYRQLVDLLPADRLEVGQVAAVTADGVRVTLLDGSLISARGTAEVGDYVYIRGGAVEGPAPTLTGVDQEV